MKFFPTIKLKNIKTSATCNEKRVTLQIPVADRLQIKYLQHVI